MKERIKTFSYAAVFAYLLNTLLPFFINYNSLAAHRHSAEMTMDSSSMEHGTPLCDENAGIGADGQAPRLGKTGKHHEHYRCGLCYLAAHGIKDLLPATALPVPVSHRIALPRAIAYSHSVELLRSPPFRSRAPPSAIS